MLCSFGRFLQVVVTCPPRYVLSYDSQCSAIIQVIVLLLPLNLLLFQGHAKPTQAPQPCAGSVYQAHIQEAAAAEDRICHVLPWTLNSQTALMHRLGGDGCRQRSLIHVRRCAHEYAQLQYRAPQLLARTPPGWTCSSCPTRLPRLPRVCKLASLPHLVSQGCPTHKLVHFIRCNAFNDMDKRNREAQLSWSASTFGRALP